MFYFFRRFVFARFVVVRDSAVCMEFEFLYLIMIEVLKLLCDVFKGFVLLFLLFVLCIFCVLLMVLFYLSYCIECDIVCVNVVLEECKM